MARNALGPPQTRVKKQETRNKKQNGLAHTRFIVCVTPKQKKNIAWFENQVLAEHVRKSQSTIYLKSHGCVHGFQNEVSLINFSTMFCKPCSLSRNRSLPDAKSARHIFVWFAKHCLAEHCLLFRGDADECQKQFCFVFCICLAFFDSRLWRPLGLEFGSAARLSKRPGTLRALHFGSTSKFSSEQRHDLISTTFQRCSNVRCPLGSVWNCLWVHVL